MISRVQALGAAALLPAPAFAAVSESTPDWLLWLVLGGVAFVVAGILLRMVLAARFPQGYGRWARQRRDAFAERNDQWDLADEEFRK